MASNIKKKVIKYGAIVAVAGAIGYGAAQLSHADNQIESKLSHISPEYINQILIGKNCPYICD